MYLYLLQFSLKTQFNLFEINDKNLKNKEEVIKRKNKIKYCK